MCVLYVGVYQRYLKNCVLIMLSQLSSLIEALCFLLTSLIMSLCLLSVLCLAVCYVSMLCFIMITFLRVVFRFFTPLKSLLPYSTIYILFVIFFLQVPEAFQGDENQGSAFVVQADPQRSPLLAHKSPTHYSQGPQM